MAVDALPKRYVLSGMIFIGFFVMSGLRVNLNVAIGAMVSNHTAVVDGETICRVSQDSCATQLLKIRYQEKFIILENLGPIFF